MSTGPNFICIGTQKGGTTALMRYLNVIDNVKCYSELHHFDHCTSLVEKRGRSVLTDSEYMDMFNTNSTRYTGEVTPSYMLIPSALESIKKLCPDVKIIILLREPISRCISQYNMDYTKNNIKVDPDVMINRMLQDVDIHHNDILENGPYYIPRGYYDEQLKHVYKLFSKEQVHVTISERFKSDTIAELNKITDFLECNRISPNESVLSKTIHSWKYDFRLPASITKILKEIYQPHVDNIYQMLGRKIEEWTEF